MGPAVPHADLGQGGPPAELRAGSGASVVPVLGVLAAGLDARRLAALGADSMVMHPGPMNRGLEISAEAADSPRSTVLEQVTNGVSVRMAALYLLLAGAGRDADTTGPSTREDAR